VTASLLTERRETAPYGLAGGEAGSPGANVVERRDGVREPVGGRATVRLAAGDRLRIETPGGGGYGPPDAEGLAEAPSGP
jgi:N-methylhydantoinase B/oxoprolinase/acetone carboxylase alpha subunit